MSLWAGQAQELASAVPAGQLVRDMIRDGARAIDRMTSSSTGGELATGWLHAARSR